MRRNRTLGHDPDDRKEAERARGIGDRHEYEQFEHEDIEDTRVTQRRDAGTDVDDIDLAEVYLIDLDAAPEGEGPDA